MDPQQQQAANAMAGVGAGVFLFIMVFALGVLAFAIFCLWRIFTKAGLSGALSLLVLIPGVGWIVALCVLAFMDWKVTPIQTGYSGLAPTGYGAPGYAAPQQSYPSPYQSQPGYTQPGYTQPAASAVTTAERNDPPPTAQV